MKESVEAERGREATDGRAAGRRRPPPPRPASAVRAKPRRHRPEFTGVAGADPRTSAAATLRPLRARQQLRHALSEPAGSSSGPAFLRTFTECHSWHTITAEQVKKLRDQTGAGMMECKAALTEANGDFEEANAILRKRGLASAAKKAGRGHERRADRPSPVGRPRAAACSSK